MAEHSRCQPGPARDPTGSPTPPRALVDLGRRLPEGEILRIVLAVLVLQDARAGLDLARVEARETAVAGKRAMAK
jgi:hypothetical protein